MDMGAIGKQTILYGGKHDLGNLEKFYFNNMKNITCEILNFDNSGNNYTTIIKSFVEKVFEKVKGTEDSNNKEIDMMDKDYYGYYGSLLILKNELLHFHSIDFIIVV